MSDARELSKGVKVDLQILEEFGHSELTFCGLIMTNNGHTDQHAGKYFLFRSPAFSVYQLEVKGEAVRN